MFTQYNIGESVMENLEQLREALGQLREIAGKCHKEECPCDKEKIENLNIVKFVNGDWAYCTAWKMPGSNRISLKIVNADTHIDNYFLVPEFLDLDKLIVPQGEYAELLTTEEQIVYIISC